jgi:diguanylate cyclase (GGDEF)-like protein
MPFSVVFMDLDRFKSVNDEHGHAEGDEYLKNFARTIEGMYKEYGNLYRMSGDEFVLIHTSPDNTRLCHEIEQFDFKGDPGRAFLGVSVGCAHYPDDATTVSELLHIADTNMYQVKKRRHAEQGAPSKD